MRGHIPVILAIALVVAGGCVNRQAQQQAGRTEKILRDPTIPVNVVSVDTRTIEEHLEITGEVTSGQDSSIGAKVGGRITAVYVREGDAVAAGQTIANLDTSSQMIQLRQAQAQVSAALSALNQARQNASVTPQRTKAAVETAKAQLRSAKAQLQKARNGARPEERRQAENAVAAAKSNMDTARKQVERNRDLFAAGAISKAQLEISENTYQAALSQYQTALEQANMARNWSRPEDISSAEELVRQAEEAVRSAEAQKRLDSSLNDQVDAARANLDAARSQVALIQQQISDAAIRSPFAGRILGRPIQAGTVVSAGAPIARVIGGQGIYFEGEAPEGTVSSIKIGSTVDVYIDALGQRMYPATVAAISPAAGNIGRLYKVRIQFTATPAEVKAGMFARGQVNLRAIQGAMVVPTSSIIRRSGEDYVFRVEGDKAKLVKISKGLEQELFTQVTGLKPGDKIVSQGQSTLEDGTPVKIVAPDNAGSTTEDSKAGS